MTTAAKNFVLQEAQAHRDMEVFMRRLFKLLDVNGFKYTVIHDSIEIEVPKKGVGA